MTADGAVICAQCGERNPPAKARCWVCHSPLAPAKAPRTALSIVLKIVLGLVLIAALIPALLVITCFGLLGVELAKSSQRGREFTEQLDRQMAKELEAVRKENPLAGEILAFQTNKTTWTTLHAAIANADAAQLSQPVENVRFGGLASTPLAMVLRESHIDWTFDFANTRPHYLEAARELMNRGARLSPEEEASNIKLAWMAEVIAKGRPLPDPESAGGEPSRLAAHDERAAGVAAGSRGHLRDRARPSGAAQPFDVDLWHPRACRAHPEPGHMARRAGRQRRSALGRGAPASGTCRPLSAFRGDGEGVAAEERDGDGPPEGHHGRRPAAKDVHSGSGASDGENKDAPHGRGTVHRRSGPAQEQIRALRTGASERERATAAEALGRMKAAPACAASPALAEALRGDASPRVRAAAAGALGELRAQEALPSLVKAVSDKDATVRTVACVALGRLRWRGKRGRARAQARAGDPDPDVQEAAERALAAVGAE